MLSQNHPSTAQPLVTDIAGIPTQFPSLSLFGSAAISDRLRATTALVGWEEKEDEGGDRLALPSLHQQ